MKREPKKSVGVYSHVVFRLTFLFCPAFLFRFLFLRVWLVTSFHGVTFVSNILLFPEDAKQPASPDRAVSLGQRPGVLRQLHTALAA